MSRALLGRHPTPAAQPTEKSADAELIQHFVNGRDHHAFAILVRRHGPMVFGVCRRVLRDPHDAEEAFQVSFLILVRKAHALRRPERLSSWLYGVAHRVARKARRAAIRRQTREQTVAREAFVASDTAGRDRAELRTVLDEEMVELPEKYRAPLVLCYLEGLTNEDAARRLGWPLGSMSYRLARGRDLLRRRLARRGLVCLALWPVFMQVLTERASAGEVPNELVDGTVDRAMKESEVSSSAFSSRRIAKWLLLLLLVLGTATAAVAEWRAHHRSSEDTPPVVVPAAKKHSEFAPPGGCHRPAP
jgi:RNA polymerase sigma factor (sigma-70 family)